MAQATNLSTTSASRFHNLPTRCLPDSGRSFIHTVAALSIAAAAPSATAHTIDADLIELGARFEPLVDQYYVARKLWARSMVAAHAGYQASDEAGAALSTIREKMEDLASAIKASPL